MSEMIFYISSISDQPNRGNILISYALKSIAFHGSPVINKKDFMILQRIFKHYLFDNTMIGLKSDNYNEIRKAIENKKVSALETNFSLNQVLCKLMHENEISLLVNLDKLIEKDKKEKALRLKKMLFNIKLCKKYKVQIEFKAEKMKKEEIKAIKDFLI